MFAIHIIHGWVQIRNPHKHIGAFQYGDTYSNEPKAVIREPAESKENAGSTGGRIHDYEP
jgi:hypothetical protein